MRKNINNASSYRGNKVAPEKQKHVTNTSGTPESTSVVIELYFAL